MTESTPSLVERLKIAFAAFMQAWRNPTAAGGASETTPLHSNAPDSALQLLALLQREGRLIDFLQQDMSAHGDADIGAAARVVHQGCCKALSEHVSITSVHEAEEGSRIAVEADFDRAAIRLTGNVVGEAPFNGTLAHRGWKVTSIELPQVVDGHDLSVIAPAEVEL